MSTKLFNDDQIDEIGSILVDIRRPLKQRFRALFMLRNIGGNRAIDAISRCFTDQSALLKHELAYCLGQMQSVYAVSTLITILDNVDEHPMVRHEAGEALGAIGDKSAVPILTKYSSSDIEEIAETCQLALRKITWGATTDECLSNNPFQSCDPTPSADSAVYNDDVEALEQVLIDESDNAAPLWDRYRAMFSLRNIGTDRAVAALAKGLFCTKSGALFRHEIAFVLGQLQSPVAFDQLCAGLERKSENAMVRHECAEALGAIATDQCRQVLMRYLDDDEVIVRESCQVALDIADYENSHDFQYANV